MSERYRLVSDDDGHHFVIPDGREDEWDSWVEIGVLDNEPQPKWAHEVGGSPTQVTFENPEIFGRKVEG